MGSTFIYDAMKDAIQMEQINLYEQVWLIITDGFIAQ